jgi:DNA-directed RNA polymerase subunit RPC12/RpoP
MCFRPPSAGKAIKCPNCGAMNPNVMKKCIKCKADLPKAGTAAFQADDDDDDED